MIQVKQETISKIEMNRRTVLKILKEHIAKELGYMPKIKSIKEGKYGSFIFEMVSMENAFSDALKETNQKIASQINFDENKPIKIFFEELKSLLKLSTWEKATLSKIVTMFPEGITVGGLLEMTFEQIRNVKIPSNWNPNGKTIHAYKNVSHKFMIKLFTLFGVTESKPFMSVQ